MERHVWKGTKSSIPMKLLLLYDLSMPTSVCLTPNTAEDKHKPRILTSTPPSQKCVSPPILSPSSSLGSLLAVCQMSVPVTPHRSEGLPRRSLFLGSYLSVLGWFTVSCSIHSPRPPGNRHQIKNKNRPLKKSISSLFNNNNKMFLLSPPSSLSSIWTPSQEPLLSFERFSGKQRWVLHHSPWLLSVP